MTGQDQAAYTVYVREKREESASERKLVGLVELARSIDALARPSGVCLFYEAAAGKSR